MHAAQYLWLSAFFCIPADAFFRGSRGKFKNDYGCSNTILAVDDESCPADSVLRRAECMCDITRCELPNCPPGTMPDVRSPALGVPDHCCETYRCVSYSPDGGKDCPVDSIRVDEYCVCDQKACSDVIPICNPGFMLILEHAATGAPGGCCNNYTCAPDPMFFCPPDSRLQKLPSGNSICVCAINVCAEPVCPEGMEVVTLYEATGTGGGCCPVYVCELNNRRKLPTPICPPDSEAIEGRYCVCRVDLCPRVSCPEGLVANTVTASGYPGDCCDRFTCRQLRAVSCPSDSVPADNGCVCDRSKCPTLTCDSDYVLQLVEPGSNVPGYCCDQFECVWSQAAEIDCPDGSELDNYGHCVCQESLCPPIPECPSGEVATMVFPAHGPGHCCPIYECHSPLPVETIECPPDSKPLLDLSGCECEMDLCQVPSCPPGFELLVFDVGSPEPGRCCPTHACQDNARCPIDSIYTENGCVCDTSKCFEATCEEDEQVVIMMLGNDQPGSCCPSFDCMVIQSSCPPDSVFVDGSCVCDTDRCPGPNVCADGEKYVVTQNASGIVGDCCDKFDCTASAFCPIDSVMGPHGCVCDGSEKPTLPDDWVVVHQGSGIPGDCFDILVEVKPCPWDSALDSNNECVCSPCPNVECELDEETLVVQEPTGVPGECCRVIECRHLERAACPYDSQWTPHGCMCKPEYCIVPKCPEGQIQSTYRTATHMPGDCCDWLVCTPIPTCPPDSQLQQNGTCKCAEYNCDMVVCDYGSAPVLVSAGLKIPGQCCDVYECRSCPYGTKLSPEGCVCDRSLCLLPTSCPDGVLVTISEESCCPLYGCMVPECPLDSFFEVSSQSCECRPCLQPFCSGEIQVQHKSSHVPGDCCDELACADAKCPENSCIEPSCDTKYLVKKATSVFPSCCDEYVCGPKPSTCPPDSILIGENCTCLQEWCPIPTCSSNDVLHVVTEAKNTPGDCCHVWECFPDQPQCPSDSYPTKFGCYCSDCIEPECEFGYVREVRLLSKGVPGDCCDIVVCQMKLPECPPGTSLNHDGKCVCDRNCSKIDCDGDLMVVKPATNVYPFCCDELICVKNPECPADSSYDYKAAGCVCNECPSVLCPDGASPELLTSSLHKPGSCCDTFTCGVVAPVLCPSDSVMSGSGCVCDSSSCAAPSCDYDATPVLLSPANTAKPGSCCDVYVCKSIRCPSDSIQINGSCECVEECLPPACIDDEVPYITRDATNHPGQCCPEYQCSTPSISVCPPGTVPSSDKKSCVCGSCSQVTCGPGFVQILTSEATLQPPDCCDVYECVVDTESRENSKAEECPKDSRKVNGICTCYECGKLPCPKNVTIVPSAGTPGDCCPVSACVDDTIECPSDSYYVNGKCECLPCPPVPPNCVPSKPDGEPQIGSCCEGYTCPETELTCPPGSVPSPDSSSCVCSSTTEECPVPACSKKLILLKEASNLYPDCCSSYACQECPLDSILTPEGICICNPECPAPVCPPESEPVVIVPKQNVTGHCCEKHVCIGIAPVQPTCDPYSVQHPNMTCECVAFLCPKLPDCPPNYHAVAMPQSDDSCCPVYSCFKETENCPQDSYISGQVCKCRTCPEQPYCPDGSPSTVKQPGTSTPGSCCDVYECLESDAVVCGYGAMSLGGQCICNIELCSAPICEPSQILFIAIRSTEIYPDCCDSFMCGVLECPPDSVLIDDKCVCVDSCPEIWCPQGTFVQIIKPPSSMPGECCFVWTCVQEISMTLATCPPDSYVTFDGQCVCNPQCISPKCPDGMVVSITEQPVNEPGKCCGQFSCVHIQTDCPLDSYVDDNECKCNPCSEMRCPDGKEPVKVESGDQIPGSCCDRYTCTVKPLNCTLGSVQSSDKCVCTGSCPHPDCGDLLVSITHKSSMVYPDCCDKLACLNLTCPKDSFLIPGENKCKCNPECFEMNCPQNFRRSLAKKGNGLPGTCCNQWKCVELPEALCPPDSISGSKGCICDKTKCLPAPECSHGSALINPATEIPGKCCPRYQCINMSCPPDSYYMNGKCLCSQCNKVVCSNDTNTVLITPGNGVPGSCCDEYMCEHKVSISCTYGSIPSTDGSACVCNTAACGIPVCGNEQQLVTIRTTTFQYPDCCNEYACIFSCPPDSVGTYDGYCVCNFDLCQSQSCPDGSALIVTKATKQPGNCCDTISCYNTQLLDINMGPSEPFDLSITVPYSKLSNFADDVSQCSTAMCDPPLHCPQGMVSVVYRKPTYIGDDCCPLYSCIKDLECPADAFPASGVCTCMECVTPFCPDESRPKLLTSGNNLPGSCCDTFECHGKQCPKGTMLVPDGRCVCVKSLCPQPHCPPGTALSILKSPASMHGDCCANYACIENCPEDSVYFDTKCICVDDCKTTCPSGMKPTVLVQGNGMPGSCCDIVMCELVLDVSEDGLTSCDSSACNMALKCPPGYEKATYHKPSGVPPDCCPKYTCVQVSVCPEDSYWQNGACICYPCPDSHLKQQKSSGQPGSCCVKDRLKISAQENQQICKPENCPVPDCDTVVLVDEVRNDTCCEVYACVTSKCPRDSIMGPGGCVCLSCRAPVCPYGSSPFVLKPSLNIPGQCCSEFICVQSQVTTCGPNMVMDSNGECICDEVCNPVQCPDGTTASFIEDGPCCPQIACIEPVECPTDSYWDGECRCKPCSIPDCPQPQLRTFADHTPGSCCDEYDCAKGDECEQGTLSSSGECVCDAAQCFTPNCHSGDTMVTTKKASKVYPDCCDVNMCVKISCPPDSYLTSDQFCSCIPNACQPVVCPPGTNLITNSSETGPGNCCPESICEKPLPLCPTYMIANSQGRCVCAPELCPPPPSDCSDGHLHVISSKLGCCPSYQCIEYERCPDDSFYKNGVCTCYPCPPPCSAEGMPGSCCKDCLDSTLPEKSPDGPNACPEPECDLGLELVVIQESHPLNCPLFACIQHCPPDRCECVNCPPEVCPPGTELVITKSAGSTPGLCCNVITCEVRFSICPMNTKPSEDGCVCDLDSCSTNNICPLGTVLVITKPPTLILSDCCPEFACISMILECPSDSYRSENECVCYPCKFCSDGRFGEILKPASNQPGSCCPVIDCGTDIATICDSKCDTPVCRHGKQLGLVRKATGTFPDCCDEFACFTPQCPPGSAMAPNGQCVCLMQCQNTTCPPGMVSKVVTKATMEPGYCCDLTICTAPTTIRCPRNTVEIDNECICYFGSCHIPLCPANYSAIVSRYATGVMGDCCDQHICVPNPSCPPDMAVIDGKCECLPCKDPFCPHGLEPVLLPEDKEKCCQPFECNKVSCPPGMLLSPDLTTCTCDTQICPVPSCLDSQVLKTVHNSDECCPSYLCVELTCHADSILIDGNCVCAPEYCQTPDCPSGKLEILQWATHQPGSCCDIFTCHGSALKPTQQPAKCPPFTRPSSNGICECDCDLCPFPPMCPPGYAPAIIKHPLMTPGSCCVEYACMPVLPDCPRDSYIQNKICQCFPCNDSPQTCSDGTSLILLKKGDGRPGSCCDVYACKEHPSCTLGGVVSADLGLKCVCQKSLCPLPSCDPTSAVRIVHKASGTYPDCCNTYACFISDCPPDSIMVDGECVCAISNRVQPCLPGLVPVVTRRGIGKPGNCGTEVVCEQPKSLDAPCPPFSIKLPDGNCVCKKDLCPDSVCPTGFSRVVLSEAKNILGLCCPEYTCIKIITCPPDSYALGDTCVCQPCPKPTCNDGSSPIIDSPGQKTPNMCCDTYHCAAATSTVCPLGSTISPDGKTCLCNASPPLSYCEPGFTFVTVQYATNIYPDCYDEVACIKLECPSDSILIDDECRCRTCEVPTCAPGSYAELVSPGFDVPGQCCGTYECNLSASIVQCPPYMIQLSDGSCHCSPKSCPMISCPSGLSTAVLSTSSCCPEFICQQSIVCPDDSYVEDNACNCLPCPVKTCQDGSSLIPIRSGNNVPGSCCDEFICAGVQTCETGFVMDVTGRCICNKHQCFIPTCSGNSTAVISRYAKENECCDKIACIEFTCPTDSFLVGSKCVCLPCQKPLCPFGTEFFNFKQRKGVPGECCDQWICKEIIPPLTSTICGKFEILVNDKCECSMDLCSAPACPPNTTTILLESDSCCPEYTCGFAFAMDCPPDSYLLDKECECYPCLEPKCPGVLEVKSHGDNRPGSCCSVYDCKEKLICPAGSIFSEAANACICDSTTCDQPKCSFGQIAILGMPSGQYPECCPKYVCMEVECPPDSLMGAYGCFCIPNYCPQNFCPQNSREILVKRASGQPGDCCDSYECQEFVIRTGCPSDSKRSPSGCVCNECTVPECTHGAVPIVMLNGTGVPGNCCPQYACFKATCPEDSYASHDECHCLPCREQVCSSGTPKTISSGDGTPGACCPVVECDESHPCPSGTKYDGSNCVCDYELCTSPQCPPGTQMLVINQTIDQINCCPDYACSCPPGQELVGGVCECSICKDQLCPSGTQKIIVRYATGVNGDCCNEIMCQEHQTIICPIDSDRTSSGCVCSGSCTETTCPANMTRIVVVEATNVPGNCCPQHSCVKPISCAVDSYWNTSGCVCLPCSEQLCEGKEEIILRGNGQPGTCCDHKICNRTEKKSNCPYKSKMGPNGTCICDTDSCSMPVCGEGYSMVLVEESLAYPDCCPEYACIATCPPDSWQSDGACQCIECSYLSCPDSTYAVVETRGMGIPGKCCDTIVCKTGQIRCPPYTEFVNGYCQCSLDLCESPPACPTDHTLIIVRMPNNFIGDCCPEYACYPHLEPCPGDSYNMNGQCICYACPTVESMLCPNGMVPTAAQNGNQQPGSCCDEYVCGSFCPRGSIYQNVTDQCICDTKLCPVPPCNASTTMAVVQDASGVYPDCCDEYACLTLDCPADSIIENQECVCANVCQPEQCSPGMELVIMQEGKNIPGECCEITSCQEVKPDSVKPCPPNSIRLSNGSCGCIPDLCPPSPKCLEGTQLTILYESQNECCPDVICSVIHECPPDSYLISGRCECLPCIQYECPPNTNMVVHRSETNSPGQCCDDYECIADQSGQAVECLRGAVLNKAGKSCVCDESSCEVPSCPNDMEIIIVAYSDKVYPECCNVFGCIHVQCPPDSELIDGICKCKRKCDIPSCPPGTVLVKESMAHGTPGKCCDNWSCDQKKSLNLVCPPNMKLIDNNCTCDKSTCSSPRCPPGTTPMAYIEQSGSPADCCPEWTCYQEIISCPPDSYLQNDECVCQPCMPPPACDNKIVSESKGEPGSCCSVYECINVENTCNSCPDIACDAGLELRLLSTPSGVYPDCCPRHACILNECPRDSFMARNGQCVCIPAYCASITCPQGTTRVIIKRAKGEPGACCDEILCLEADSTKEPTDKNESPTCPPFMKWAPEQTCVCAQELCPPKPMCPPGTISIIYKHPSKISGDCCPQYTCISALPDCPGDSYFLNGTCACYPCPSPPPCPQGQKVVESGDGRPGSCCSEYQCEETHAECTCPYGQTAGPDCTCVCSKKRCNRPVCEQGSVPRVIISATMVVPDCCDVIACVEFNCPPDSLLNAEGECVCMENYCSSFSCPDGSERIILSPAKNIPGQCCDAIVCDVTVALCPLGTTLTSYGVCECLIEVCPLPPDCPHGSSLFLLDGDVCCPQYGCYDTPTICPPDSYNVNDGCECLPCRSHDCQGKLVTLQRGNGRPGTCCPKTVCEEENAICPLGTRVTKDGQCKCETSQCTKPLCDSDFMLVVIRKATQDVPDCCDTFACFEAECPIDSIATSSGECMCLPNACHPPPCWPGSRLVKILRGFGIPGKCCDKWMCEQAQDQNVIACPPFHMYQDGLCTCEESYCPPKPICPEGFTAMAHQAFSCCPEYFCFPLLTDCPGDSYYDVDGTCKCYPCNQSSCPEGFETVLSMLGNKYPGSCCDVHTCQLFMPDYDCGPCGVMQTDGQCACSEGCCAASPPCPDGVLVISKTSTGLYPDCCDKYACIRKVCPANSILDEKGNCICQTCPEPKCPSGTVQIDVAPTGEPGNCCGTWSCKTGIEKSCPEPPSCSMDYQLVHVDTKSGCKIFECKRVECPSDSVNVNGMCYCDVSRCPSKYCGIYEIMISVRKSTNSPGDCCDQVMCLANYCPPYHVYDAELESCVCAPSLCPPTPQCGNRRLLVDISIETERIWKIEGCCFNYACGVSLACPFDSQPNAQNTGCVCDYRNCVVPTCLEGETLLEVLPLSSTPGFCCPAYLCKVIIECPWDSKMVNGPDSELYCECDPLRCPPQSCPHHAILYVTSRSVGTPGSCCSNSECETVPCPPYTTQDEFGNCICKCELCPPPSCSIGFSIVIISECGTPPFCCPQFECIKQEVSCQFGEIWVDNECQCKPETCQLPKCCTILLPLLPGQCCHPCICLESEPQCPPDSYFDSLTLTCACLPCQKISCSSSAVVTKPGTSKPGSCCPQYTCSYQKLCPPGSVLDGTDCICNPDSCPHPLITSSYKMIVSHVSSGKFPDCCDEVLVIPDLDCPSDAIMYHNGACYCPECPDPSCPPGSTPYIVRRAAGVPGQCCEVYQCKVITQVCPDYAFENNGACECRADRCYRPSCSPGFMLVETNSSTNVYPDCCPTYECTIIPICPCDSRLNRLTGKCICDPTLCPVIQCPNNETRVIVREASGSPGDCCNSYLCMRTVVCPADSRIEGDECVCDKKRCREPTCDANFTLVELRVGKDTPGACCSHYECRLIQCPYGTRYDQISESCVCDRERCVVPECHDGSVLIKQKEATLIDNDCCDSYVCQWVLVKCPPDSKRHPLTGHCECSYPSCPPVKCSDSFQPVITREPQNIPGQCCPSFECRQTVICPIDSKPNINGICVCSKNCSASIFQCKEGMSPVLKEPKTGMPGQCCDVYSCSNKCPVDSMVDESGECVCDMASCSDPICPDGMVSFVVALSSGVPGECCNKHQCHFQCPRDSRYNESLGSCSCHLRSCSEAKCPDSLELKIISQPTGKPGRCCVEFECIAPCPDDSVWDARSKSCVCAPCKKFYCPQGQHAAISWAGSNTPGECCPKYNCTTSITIQCSEFAVVNENNACTCVPSLCPKKSCDDAGSRLIEQDSFIDANNCCPLLACEPISCPPDSVLSEEGECLCDFAKCKSPGCPTPFLRGDRVLPVPGSCCLKYSCNNSTLVDQEMEN